MDLSKISDVKITTFINPHLFWIIKQNEENVIHFSSLNKQMKECVITKNCDSTSHHFKRGEIVAAQIDNKLYRAIIEAIIPQNSWRLTYMLWLIDLGTMKETNYVFELPTNLKKIPHFAQQASLNNVKYLNQTLEYNSLGELVKINKSMLNPTPSCRQETMNFLSDGHNFKFSLEKEEDGILFGDILYKNKENEQISLRECLCNAGVIVKELLEGVTDYINDYKDRNLMYISKICQIEPHLLENEINENVGISCNAIVSKILEEFQCSDELSCEDKVSEPLCPSNESKSSNASLDQTMSDNQSPNAKKCKIFKVIEKLRQHQNDSKLNESITSDSAVDRIDQLTDKDYNKFASKINQLIEKTRQHQNATELNHSISFDSTEDNIYYQLPDKDATKPASKMNQLMEKMRQHQNTSKLNHNITSDSTKDTIDDQLTDTKSTMKMNQWCDETTNVQKSKYEYEDIMEGKIIFGPAGSERSCLTHKMRTLKMEKSLEDSSNGRKCPERNFNKKYNGTTTSPSNPKIIKQPLKQELKLSAVKCNYSEEEDSSGEQIMDPISKIARIKEQSLDDSSTGSRCPERKFNNNGTVSIEQDIDPISKIDRKKEQSSDDSSNSRRYPERKFNNNGAVTSPICPESFPEEVEQMSKEKSKLTDVESNTSKEDGSSREQNMDPTSKIKEQSSDDSSNGRGCPERNFNNNNGAVTSPICPESFPKVIEQPSMEELKLIDVESNSSKEQDSSREQAMGPTSKIARIKEQSLDDSSNGKRCPERQFNNYNGAVTSPICQEVLKPLKPTDVESNSSEKEGSSREHIVDPTSRIARLEEQSSDDSSNCTRYPEKKMNNYNGTVTSPKDMSMPYSESNPKMVKQPSKEELKQTDVECNSSAEESSFREQNMHPTSKIDTIKEQTSDDSSNSSKLTNYNCATSSPKEMPRINSESNPEKVEQLSDKELKLTDVESNSSKEEVSLTDCDTQNSNPDCQHLQLVQPLKIKPHCNCKQCAIWTKEEDIILEKMDPTSKVAKIKDVKSVLLLKENENIDPDFDICSIDYASMNKVDKQSAQKVLTHSQMMLNPVYQIHKLTFHKNIHTSLHNLQYRKARRIQIYTWSAILRNQHVFMIHGPRTGKSMAYMPCMLTFILEKHDRYSSLLKVAGGPIVIILCGNTDKCEQLLDLAKLLMQNKKSNISLVTYPLGHVNTSHTDMLITTPDILIDLLKNNSINFKRLCHLVIEDGDTVLTKHKDAMDVIFDLMQSMLKNRLFSKSLQLVVCAEHWNYQMKHLIKNLQQVPLVCIGNPLEAALYGQVEISMKFKDAAFKEQELENILKEHHRIYKSMIICRDNEIDNIVKMLGFGGIDYIAVPLSLGVEDILHLENVWKSAKGGSYSVLVCSDFVLNTFLNVTCAEVLIHYSLPSTWTKFTKRFNCLLENCKSPLVSKPVNYFAKSIILYDGCCNDPLKKFLNYMASTDSKKYLPITLQKYSENLKQAEENEKLKQDICLCENLKLFGYCTKIECPKRHVLNTDLDVSQYFPKSGKVKFKIVNIIDVSIYIIQLLQHVDNDNKIHEYDEISDITEDLTKTLTLDKKEVHDPVLGKRYAFHNTDEQDANYYRCEVLSINKENVKIKLLDKGTIINSTNSRLFCLPDEFDIHTKPRQTIDCYLANCIPPYRDENFSAKSFFNATVILESKDYKNIIFTGEVRLQLNHTLWLKDVYEEVVLSDAIIPRFQLSREIIVQKLVNNKSNQLDNLYKMCAEAGIDLPKYDMPIVKIPVKKQNIEKKWAYLDTEQVNEVTFAAAFSPDEIYVKLNKFSNLLCNLQKEIQRSIERPNYPKIQEVFVGDIYLAKEPNGDEYCRVLALKIQDNQVLCFYVDFADETVINVEDLKHIQDVYITKLPFQCIKCSLYGIRPIYNEWDEDVTGMLYNYAHEPDTDIFRTLYLKVCQKKISSAITPTKYSVLLKDSLHEKKTLINQILIECGMALANSEESLEDFEIPVRPDTPELNEDLEEAAYICRKTEELDECFHGNVSASPENKKEDYNSDDMELFTFGDPIDFLINIVTGNESSPIERIRELPAITAAPSTDYCTPDVYWSQTESTVKLSIRLADIKDYKLTLTKGRMFDFKTINNEKTYCLKLILYRLVETVQHTSLGPEIRVVMTKSTIMNWPRLISSKQKARNIHYDVNKLPTEECDENKKILQLPKELTDGLDELNEDDPMYTVYSDLDSDLDEELQNDSD